MPPASAGPSSRLLCNAAEEIALQADEELAMSGREERLFEASGLGVGQSDADQGRAAWKEAIGLSPPSTNWTPPAGL
jgi:hypothetical protein